jgi:hypothetical protein
MMFLSALGEFPEMVLGLAFSLGCALLLGFLCLRLLLGLMTRQQVKVSDDRNVIHDPSHVGSLLLLGAAVAGSNSGPNDVCDDERGGGATGSPYLLPAASPRNRFARISNFDDASGGRVVEFPVPVAGGVAQGGLGNSWTGNGGDAA